MTRRAPRLPKPQAAACRGTTTVPQAPAARPRPWRAPCRRATVTAVVSLSQPHRGGRMRFRFPPPRRVACAWLVVATCAATAAIAQDEPPKLSASQLESLVAPIALYPDQILAQVMTASTFPDECVAANSWAQAHKELHGDALSQAMSDAAFEWDPSVQALVPFPTVLETMTRNRGDLDRLGNAVLVQRGDVMDAIQSMRHKAQEAGNLKSGEQMTVQTEGSDIIIA